MSERIDQPRAGFYRGRLIRGGLHVAIRFWCEGGQWRVEVNGRTHRVDGQPICPFETWNYVNGAPISEREYHFLMRRKAWAVEHDPEHPAAKPYEPIDLSKVPPRF